MRVTLAVCRLLSYFFLLYTQFENTDDADMYNEKLRQKPRFKKKLESVRQKIYGPAHFECYMTPICDPNMKVLTDTSMLLYFKDILVIYTIF